MEKIGFTLVYDEVKTVNGIESQHVLTDYNNTLIRGFTYSPKNSQEVRFYYHPISIDQYSSNPKEFGLFPIKPISLSNVGTKGPLLDASSASIINSLSHKARNLIKNPKSGLHLLIDYSMEGWELSKPIHDWNGIKFFNFLFNIVGIPKNKVIFLHGNLNSNSKTYINTGLDKNYMLNINIFESIASGNTLGYETKSSPEIKFNTTPTKKFIFKNNHMNPHRLFFIDYLNSVGGLEQAHWSMVQCLPNFTQNYKSFWFDKYFENDYLASLAAERIEKLQNGGPYLIDVPDSVTDKSRFNWEWGYKVGSEIYYDSLFSLVSETTMDELNNELLFVTEKSFIPMTKLHPFLILGCYNTLSHLRDIGYKTFPELFDESYDQEKHFLKRAYMVKQNLDRVLKTPIGELEKMFKTKTVYEKLLHNQDRIYEHKKRIHEISKTNLLVSLALFLLEIKKNYEEKTSI